MGVEEGMGWVVLLRLRRWVFSRVRSGDCAFWGVEWVIRARGLRLDRG